MRLVRAAPTSDDALAASARFYAETLPAARAQLDGMDPAQDPALTLIFDPADHRHRGWRLAAVQDLARAYAPIRVNAVAGGDQAGVSRALAYLTAAPGVTGQVLALDGAGADEVVSSPA